jgi:hypothetical protein
MISKGELDENWAKMKEHGLTFAVVLQLDIIQQDIVVRSAHHFVGLPRRRGVSETAWQNLLLKATPKLGRQARDGIAGRKEQHPPLRSKALKWPRLAGQAVGHRANIDKLFTLP